MTRPIVDDSASLMFPTTKLAVQVGVFSFSVCMPTGEPRLKQEFSELYRPYPKVELDQLTDASITLTYPTLRQRFLGREITTFLDGVQLYEPWSPRLGVPMLESALNAWMGKNITRYLLVHAGVVEREGWALVLPGPSGAGKSTLSTILATRGWRFLSDEIAIIRPDDGLILPHPRPIPMKNESIDMMTGRLPDAYLSKRYEGTTKGTVAFLRPPEEAIKQALDLARPKIVVFPQFDAKGKTELKRMEKAPAFMRLIDNSPQYFTLLETGFETLAEMVDACTHYKLTYNDVDSAIALIESLEPDDRGKTS